MATFTGTMRAPNPSSTLTATVKSSTAGRFPKPLAPGFRISWIETGAYRTRILRQKFLSSMASPTLGQMAVAEYLKRASLSRQVRQVRRLFADRFAQYRDCILSRFPSGTQVTRPSVGWATWISLPNEIDAESLFFRALNAGIVVAPGPVPLADAGLQELPSA